MIVEKYRLREYLKVAKNVAKEAGKITLELQENIDFWEKSSFHDIATKADLKVEEYIIETLKENFPEIGFIAEESGSKGKTEICWIIDPIDGTNNYASKLPIFCNAIALAANKEVILGVINDPNRKELFYAAKNLGSYLNNKKIKVKEVKNEKAICVVPISARRSVYEMINLLLKIKKFRAFRVLGSSELQLAWLAANRVHAVVHTFLNPWDGAAGSIIVEEAKGKVTNFRGERWKLSDRTMIASSKKLHKILVESFYSLKERAFSKHF